MHQIDVCELLGSLFSYRCWSMGFFRRFDNSPRLKFFGTSEHTNMRVCFECVCMSACKFVCTTYTTHSRHFSWQYYCCYGPCFEPLILCAFCHRRITSKIKILICAHLHVFKKNLRQSTKFYQLTK